MSKRFSCSFRINASHPCAKEVESIVVRCWLVVSILFSETVTILFCNVKLNADRALGLFFKDCFGYYSLFLGFLLNV